MYKRQRLHQARFSGYTRRGSAVTPSEVHRLHQALTSLPLEQTVSCARREVKVEYGGLNGRATGKATAYLIGVPGGKESPFVQSLLSATKKEGDKVDFAQGKGSDADSKALVWIMDTAAHPSYRAENYHQFHDGFARGENYPDAYNSLRDGLQGDTACPSF